MAAQDSYFNAQVSNCSVFIPSPRGNSYKTFLATTYNLAVPQIDKNRKGRSLSKSRIKKQKILSKNFEFPAPCLPSPQQQFQSYKTFFVFFYFAQAWERTQDILVYFHLFYLTLPLSYTGSLKVLFQGALTEREGSVRLTSLLG